MVKSKKFLYWVVGCIIAAIGVSITRFHLISGFSLTQYRLPFLIIGTTIAFIGLWILTKGTGCQCDIENENKRGNSINKD